MIGELLSHFWSSSLIGSSAESKISSAPGLDIFGRRSLTLLSSLIPEAGLAFLHKSFRHQHSSLFPD